jgi:tetratricopeptide (TPR) repeat protein
MPDGSFHFQGPDRVTPFQMPTLPPEAVADDRTIAAVAARAVALAKAGDGRGALALAKVARTMAQGMELERGELEALNAAAIVHLLRGDSISAVAAAMDACDIARRIDDRALAAQARVSLHLSSFNLGARGDVEPGLRGCVADAMELLDRPLEVRARTALGVVYGDEGRFDAASFEFERALVTARLHGGTTCPARLVSNLANLHRKRALAALAEGYEARALRECAEAVALARRACGLAAREGATPIEIDALGIWGCVRVIQGEPGHGRMLLEESVALGRGARWRPATVWVSCELGALLASLDHLEAARAAYAEAYETACTLRPSRKIALACEGLAHVAARRGEVADAELWRRKAEHEAAEYERVRRATRSQVESFLLAA